MYYVARLTVYDTICIIPCRLKLTPNKSVQIRKRRARSLWINMYLITFVAHQGKFVNSEYEIAVLKMRMSSQVYFDNIEFERYTKNLTFSIIIIDEQITIITIKISS